MIKHFREPKLFRLLLIAFFTLLFHIVSAQKSWYEVSSQQPEPAFKNLLFSDIEISRLHVSVGGFFKTPVSTPRGEEHVVSVEGGFQITEKGMPDLEKLAATFVISDKAEMELKVITADFVDIHGIRIAPSKGHFPRSQKPGNVPYKYSEAYETDAFWPPYVAQLEDAFILRDFRGQTLTIFPFRYNPVQGVLRVYTELVIEVSQSGRPGANQLERKSEEILVETEFGHIYRHMFINMEAAERSYPILEAEDGSILIIAVDDYLDDMLPFVNWKRTIGRRTEMVALSETGDTPEEIKTFVEDYYNDNDDFAYLLLVGDGPDIPPVTIPNVLWPDPLNPHYPEFTHSDAQYSFLVGNDSYSDIFVGRFSAESSADVQTQVQRIMHYERDIDDTDTWLNIGMGIARNEGEGDGHMGGESDYEHMDFIRDTLINFTYEEVYRNYDGDVPDLPNTTPAIISDGLNEGVSIVNYCNHGSINRWSVASYSINHVNNLTNVNRLPFIWSVACQVGNFVDNLCFAETWMRATHEGEPTGAIGFLGSTIHQTWLPPMTGQDEMVTILAEQRDHIKRTFGGLSFNGSMKMIPAHGTEMGGFTHETWLLFGDPTLLVRTDIPQPITAQYPKLIIDTSNFTVEADVPNGSTAALSYYDAFEDEVVLFGSATFSNGTAVVSYDHNSNHEHELALAITAFNRITLLDIIPVYTGEGTEENPYLVFTANQLAGISEFGGVQDIHFLLMNDIDLDIFPFNHQNGWQPIQNFRGVFDGNDYVIDGLYISALSENGKEHSYNGLFGEVNGAVIKNLGIINVNIESLVTAGVLAGRANNYTLIENCVVSGNIVAGNNPDDNIYAGGVVGELISSTIKESSSTVNLEVTGNYAGGITGRNRFGSLVTDCFYEGELTGNDYVGGISGLNFRSTIQDCQSVALIYANNYAGGLVGDNHGSIIQSCHAMGVIYANNMVGGLAGSNRILFEPEIQSTIADSQSGTHLIANNHVGGIAGHNSYSLINNCQSSGEIEGNQRVGGLIGTHGASVVMYSQSSSPVTGTGDMVGGLVGESVDTSVVSYCESSGPVQGAGSVGGIAGRVFHDSTTIEHCTSTSDITSTGLYTGGLVGYAFSNALIQHSNHEGNIAGSHYTGGLIGYGEHNTNILNSSASGNITGKNFTGGLAGFIDSNSLISNSFFDGAVQGDDNVGGLAGKTIDMEINYSGSTGVVQGDIDVGGVTGYSFISTINNSFSESNVTAIGWAGGLVGLLHSSHVFQCYSAGNVNGSGSLGGLVGINTTSSSIKECFSTSNVTGTGNNIGGLVGENAYSTLIENSYATGNVQGNNVVGGLTGAMYQNATLTNAYSTGAVLGTGHLVGGLVGVTNQSVVTNSYWNLETSGMDASAGGEGLMVNEMIQQQSFADWDFYSCWNIEEGQSYPYLSWQDEPGEHNYPPEYFTLSMLEPSGNGTVIPEPGDHEYLDGIVVEINAFPDLGYVFSHWVGDVDDALEASTSITMDEDKDIQAVFTEFVAAGIPFSEDFNGLAWGTIPDFWTRTHDYWGAGSYDFGTGNEREMHFTPPWTPETDAFMLITPKLDGTGHSIINLSFRHALNDLVGGYSLKVQASVDEVTWSTYWQHDVPPSAKDAIPGQHTETNKDPESYQNRGKASIPESELIVDLSALADEMFYIAFVFDGYTGNVMGWYIDDVLVTNQQLFYKPTNLTAQEEDGQVDLQWNAPPDDTIIGYNVYRNGIKLNPDPINTTYYTDPHTETGVEYYYHVTALYADGESDPSNTVKIFRFEGSGTAEDPWLVPTAVHLDNVRNYLGPQHGDKHFRQTAHIDLGVSPWNDTPGWKPIGFFDIDMFEENGFSGTYDGDHFVIDGLFAFRQTCNEVGLFGYLDGAVIKNLGITNANVTGYYTVGILAGEVNYSTIENCFTTGYAMAQQMHAGGLAGLGSSSTIKNSYSRAMVITNGDHAAGLVASAFQSTIENSYSTGLVYTSGASGGLISSAWGLQVINSYWDAETSQQGESAGGESRTTAQMTYPYDENTYVDWDFIDVWSADPDHQYNSGYPRLQVKETFVITATAGEGGSITPTGDIHVPYGHDQAFTIAADEGYEIEDVIIDGQSIGATSYYYFGHVVKDHTIHAEFSAVTVIIPDHVSVNEYVQHTGEEDCFNAYKTIQMAGNGGYFIVEMGGSVTLIAGESIMMLPGTHAKEGSYLHAYIAPDGPFCEQFDRHFLAADDNEAEEVESITQPTHAQPVTYDASETDHYDQAHEFDFKVYPNPGRHIFTLEFSNPAGEKEFTVEVFNIYGTMVKRKVMQYSFSLEGHKPGMYLVRVVQGGQARTVRLLKY